MIPYCASLGHTRRIAVSPDRCRCQPSPITVTSRSPPPFSSGSTTPRAPEVEFDSCCVCGGTQTYSNQAGLDIAPCGNSASPIAPRVLGPIPRASLAPGRPLAPLVLPRVRALDGRPSTMRRCATSVRTKVCRCQSGFLVKRLCGRPCKTMHCAPSPPTTRPNHLQASSATRGAGGIDFVAMQRRDMQWAPQPIRHDAGIAASRPAWVGPGRGMQRLRQPALVRVRPSHRARAPSLLVGRSIRR